MKRKAMWMGIAVLVLTLGYTAVQARGHRGRQHHNAGPRFEALDLTQEQKDQMRSLRTKNRKAMIELKAKAELAQVELHELMRERNPSEKKVEQAVAKINAARGKMMERQVKQKLAMKKVLTDEQLQKLEEMPKGRRGGGEGGRYFRGQRRGHPGQGQGMGMGWHQQGQPQGNPSQI